jgi:hypothetical protein
MTLDFVVLDDRIFVQVPGRCLGSMVLQTRQIFIGASVFGAVQGIVTHHVVASSSVLVCILCVVELEFQRLGFF